MKVTVAENDLRHRALILAGGRAAWCCEAGHADAPEAAQHAWKLTQALKRHEAERAAA